MALEHPAQCVVDVALLDGLAGPYDTVGVVLDPRPESASQLNSAQVDVLTARALEGSRVTRPLEKKEDELRPFALRCT